MDTYQVKIDIDAFLDIQEAADWYNYKVEKLGNRFKRNVKLQINSLKTILKLIVFGIRTYAVFLLRNFHF